MSRADEIGGRRGLSLANRSARPSPLGKLRAEATFEEAGAEALPLSKEIWPGPAMKLFGPQLKDLIKNKPKPRRASR